MSNPQRDPYESSDVSPPRVDPTFGQALVRILDVDIDPKGESQIVTITNFGVDQNGNPIFSTNITYTPIPTNVVLNFQKTHYRVTRDVTNFWGGTPVTVYVNRNGTNISAGATAYWRINNYFLESSGGLRPTEHVFPAPTRFGLCDA